MTKRYPGQTEPAISHLTLDVPAGEICVLVGRSGCGKTTAMRMANHTVEITGVDIDKQDPAAVATQYLKEDGYIQ